MSEIQKALKPNTSPGDDMPTSGKVFLVIPRQGAATALFVASILGIAVYTTLDVQVFAHQANPFLLLSLSLAISVLIAFVLATRFSKFLGGELNQAENTRQHAIDKLSERDNRYWLFFELFPEAIVVHREGRVVYVNPAGVKLFGANSAAELIGLSSITLVAPSLQDSAEGHMDRILKQGETFHLKDRQCQRLDGSTFDVEVTAMPFVEEGQNAFLTIVREVTERKQAEQALRESEEKFRLISEQSIVPIAIFQDGLVPFANQAFLDLSGYSAAEIAAWHVGDHLCLVHPDDRERFVEEVRHKLAFDKPTEARSGFRGIAKDGQLKWIDHYSKAVTFQGKPSLLMITFDVSEQKRTEEALRESEERFRSFVEHAILGIYQSTPEGKVIAANLAFAKLVGCSSVEEVKSLDMEKYSALHDYPRDVFKQILERDGTVVGFEGSYTDTGGQTYYLRENARAVRDWSGRVIYYEGTIEDITLRKHLEEQLQHAQRIEAIGRLAGGVAHDFNNVLQALLGLAEILPSHRHDAADFTATVTELREHIKRAAALTRQLLLFSRREVSKPERVDICEIARDSFSLLRRLVRENITFKLDLAKGTLPVQGDRGQIEQVLMNLVVNASDAMPEGGVLTICTWRRDASLAVLEVRDTGCGIDERVKERIFEPFFTTKDAGRGTGLGLAVVHGIVTAHGGFIEVESAVGKGTRFSVSIPLARIEASLPRKTAAIERKVTINGRGQRVLVVEDEEGARTSLMQILDILGFEVVAVASGEEALKIAPDSPFDLLLTDYVLPGMNGAELASKLKSVYPSLHIVLMSGYAEDGSLRDAIGRGEIRFLQKPFDLDTLARELAEALTDITTSEYQ